MGGEGTGEEEEGRAGLYKEREWGKSRELWLVSTLGAILRG